MLRRSLFACALMLAGVVGFASSAKAGTATAKLAGDVLASCTFDNATAVVGVLAPNLTNTGFTTTTPATIPVTCNADATLKVDAPTKAASSTGITTFVSTSATATLNGKNVNSGDAPIAITTLDSGVISVGMTATASAPMETGTYDFDVVLTTTP